MWTLCVFNEILTDTFLCFFISTLEKVNKIIWFYSSNFRSLNSAVTCPGIYKKTWAAVACAVKLLWPTALGHLGPANR